MKDGHFVRIMVITIDIESNWQDYEEISKTRSVTNVVKALSKILILLQRERESCGLCTWPSEKLGFKTLKVQLFLNWSLQPIITT